MFDYAPNVVIIDERDFTLSQGNLDVCYFNHFTRLSDFPLLGGGANRDSSTDLGAKSSGSYVKRCDFHSFIG
jgi:hypothetical protein